MAKPIGPKMSETAIRIVLIIIRIQNYHPPIRRAGFGKVVKYYLSRPSTSSFSPAGLFASRVPPIKFSSGKLYNRKPDGFIPSAETLMVQKQQIMLSF